MFEVRVVPLFVACSINKGIAFLYLDASTIRIAEASIVPY